MRLEQKISGALLSRRESLSILASAILHYLFFPLVVFRLNALCWSRWLPGCHQGTTEEEEVIPHMPEVRSSDLIDPFLL